MKIAGKRVIDAKRALVLHITKSDVKRGNTRDPGGCAAAVALQRQLHCRAARVHLGRTYVETPHVWLRYFTPQSLRTEIVSFDRGGGFQGGEFRLPPMTPSKTLGRGRQEGSSTNQTNKRRRRHIHNVWHRLADVRHRLAR